MAPRKHQGRLEASVESRALHLATTEMKVVLRDHSDALVCWHALATVYESTAAHDTVFGLVSFCEALDSLDHCFRNLGMLALS